MKADVRAHEAIEEEIAVFRWLLPRGTKDQAHAQAQTRADGGGGAAVIGLKAAVGHQCVSALVDRVGNDVLELANLVARGFQAGEVVAFEEEAADVQMPREVIHLHKRRREQCERNSWRLAGVHQLPR